MRKERNKQDRKERFLGKVTVAGPDDCWNWKGPFFSGKRYGIFYWGYVDGKEKMISAHRAAMLLLDGPVPAGVILCHRCNNPSCVNPAHIYHGSHKTNAEDRDAAGTTSRWDKRYNFKRNPELIRQIIECFKAGNTAEQTRKILGIGWQTIYRAREQSEELRSVIAETKSKRYSDAAKQRWVDGHGKGSRGG